VGFWDVRLADLEAEGEYFTEDDVKVLEEGGRVLHLHPLETPDVEVRDWCVYPKTSEIVVMPEMADVYGPRQAGPDWLKTAEGGPYLSVAHFMDRNHTWQGNRSSWTDYPRLLGEPSHEHFFCNMRCEEVSGFAYWNCHPIVGDYQEQLAKEIIRATNVMMDGALYPQVDWLCRMAYEGEWDYADPWLAWNHPKRWKKADLDTFLEQFEAVFGHYAEEALKEQAEAFEDLYKARIIDVECKGFEDLAHGEEWGQMPFVPVEQILWNDGHYSAYDFYMKALAKRQYTLSRRPRITNYRGISEDEVED
jgi:hypothetical protein